MTLPYRWDSMYSPRRARMCVRPSALKRFDTDVTGLVKEFPDSTGSNKATPLGCSNTGLHANRDPRTESHVPLAEM